MSDDRVLKGIGLRLIAIFFLSTMSALVKLAESRGASLFETMFWRQACALPVVLAFVMAGPGLKSLRTTRLTGHATRAMIGLVGMVRQGVYAESNVAEVLVFEDHGYAAHIFSKNSGAVQ